MKNFKIKPTLIALSALVVAFLVFYWCVIGYDSIISAVVLVFPGPL